MSCFGYCMQKYTNYFFYTTICEFFCIMNVSPDSYGLIREPIMASSVVHK